MKQMGMKKAHREHVIRNMATSFLLYESIETTETKAKELKSYVEEMISKAKNNDLHARRQIGSLLFDKNATKKLFDDLIVRYKDRNSGFIRSYRTGKRIGDNASTMRLDLIDKKKFVADSNKAVKTEEVDTEDMGAKKKEMNKKK